MNTAASQKPISHKLSPSIVRIFDQNHRVVGTGFIISDSTICTCAHVVLEALDRTHEPDRFQRPTEKIAFDFLFLNSSAIRPSSDDGDSANNVHFATVAQDGWHPEGSTSRSDIAILTITSTPQGARIPTIARGTKNAAVEVFGFPDGNDIGTWVDAKLSYPVGAGRIEVVGTDGGQYKIQKGFSGAAVWSKAHAAVVGMIIIAEKSPGVRVAYMVPSEILTECSRSIPSLPQIPVEPSRNGNPFLSELQTFPRLRRWVSSTTGPIGISAISFIAALISLILSERSGTKCMSLDLGTAAGHSTHRVVFGYWGELNHGPFQLFIAPIFIYLVFRFLFYTESAIRQLSARRLRVVNLDENTTAQGPIDIISTINRRLFKWITPIICIIAFSVVIVGEWASRDRLALGWVQADHVYRLARRVQSNHNESPLTIQDLEKEGANGLLPSADRLCMLQGVKSSDCKIFINRVQGGTTDEQRGIFLAFLTWSLLLQASFISFAVWAVSKILLLFLLLTEAFSNRIPTTSPTVRPIAPRILNALRQAKDTAIRIDLDFKDEGRRFGLRSFDRVYTNALLLVLIGAIGSALSFMNNFVKNTEFITIGRQAEWIFVGQVFLSALTLQGLALIPTIPAIILLRKASTQREEELYRLERQLANEHEIMEAAHDEAAVEQSQLRIGKLQRYKLLADEQTAWPNRNTWFWPLFAASIVFFLVGVGIPTYAAMGTGSASTFIDAAQFVPRQVLCIDKR